MKLADYLHWGNTLSSLTIHTYRSGEFWLGVENPYILEHFVKIYNMKLPPVVYMAT